MASQNPKLYLFPVPMGETSIMDVVPQKNVEIIRNVKHFIVENIRSARRFLKACDRNIDIDTLTFAELNRHTDPKEVASMLLPLEQGFSVGVISEAGCPAIADPGADVVAIAQRKGWEVVPLVGPSSIIMSLMASGFNGQSFAFIGYLPIDSQARLAKLKEMERRIKKEDQTQIFIETPYRNNKLVEWLCNNLASDVLMCIASDITGPNESIITMPVGKWKQRKFDYSKTPTIFLLYHS